MQKVDPHIRYGAVNTIDPLLLFLPVGRELGLMLQPALSNGQLLCQLLEAVNRFNDLSIR